jgi:3-deoxy-D-manno-octulosonate 8-phosphate phosphatase (KDO 8-P phosphatase)
MFRKAANIKALLFDVDGVLTAGQITLADNAQQLKIFNSLDGFGIKLAKSAGLKLGIISASGSEAIHHRAKYLGFDAIFTGSYSKTVAYETFKSDLNLEDSDVCYMGDDIPDLPLLNRVGLPVTVPGAAATVLENVPYRTVNGGGQGAVRELVEFILAAKGIRNSSIERILSTFVQ